MNAVTPAVFDLPDRLAAKADPGSIGDDLAHFAAIAGTLDTSIAELSDRLDAARRARGGSGQVAMERDQEVHRLTARRRTLRRYGLDLCLGRMVPADGSAPVYVGRLGLRDAAGRSLLVDWRSPAAEPFFGATHAQPMGLASRRRYRWTRGRITDYWDEVFDPSRLDGQVALDDQSAFIASLGDARSERMRDVLGTIQADQDAIIRRGSAGTLVVDGGPGTGKTVVALHRCAYLLYADPRLGHHRGGLLFVGPHQPYLAYVSDVLPSLGEPFSAVDPVVRAQLQDEFIRLQADLGKTIVFVTHDIDEAVKLGDRIAVFAVGGRLAQYAEPAEVLSRPADDFVADFVGRDRGYRALSFVHGRLPVHDEQTLALGSPVPAGAGAAAEGISADHGRWILVVDEADRPRGWLDCAAVPVGHVVTAADLVLGGSLAAPDASLRRALDAALSSPSGRGVAVDGDGTVIGTIAAGEVLAAIEQARRVS